MEKNSTLEKINVVGDRVLVKPRKKSERTDSGLYLPPGVREKEKIQAEIDAQRGTLNFYDLL